jgi:thioredoxin reductase
MQTPYYEAGSPQLSRRELIRHGMTVLAILALPLPLMSFSKNKQMATSKQFDVIIIGGSYSGLAAGMALGRALRRVLIIDSGMPCNRQTPYSHNFLTQDGRRPQEITEAARRQVAQYDTVAFYEGRATRGRKKGEGFEIETGSGEAFSARKLIFAAGIRDIMPGIEGYARCWGISVLHCPYCHGYEVRRQPTAILGNGEYGFEFAGMISNWTSELTLFTNGPSALSPEQAALLRKHQIAIIEKEVAQLEHTNGHLQRIRFRDGTAFPVNVMYARAAFEQHSAISAELGCALTEEGYIQTDAFQKTTVAGVFASGDSTTRLRTVANAVATGTTAGMMANKELVMEDFMAL